MTTQHQERDGGPMKRIEKLTPEQESMIPVWREKWRSIGLSTERIVPEKAKQSVRELYRAAGLEEPELILVSQSPLQALLMRGVLMNTGIKDQLWDQLWDQLTDQLWDQLWDQLRGQLRGQDLYQSLWMVGGWDSFWLAFYMAGKSVGANYPVALDKHLSAYVQYAETCGLAFCYPKIAFVCDRPTHIGMDDDRRLHDENGPALAWSDGYAIHAWHGRRVPGHWIEKRDSIDPAEIITHENVEMRAVGAAVIGWNRIKADPRMNYTVISDSKNPDIGKLVELTMPGLPKPGRFLEAKCPRNGTIFEGVPDISDIDGLPIDTPLAAQAWRVGDPLSEYIHPENRT